MKSFTYDKNTYLPQCISDVDGKINRFEYDVLNRLITSGRKRPFCADP
ncbi:MAG: hypothetical protein R3C61_25125 [Bacteroidia bacterium]